MGTIDVGMFTDSHEGQTLDVICNLFQRESVQHTWFFGDGTYKTQAPLTLSNSRSATHLKRAFLRNTSLRQDLKDGVFSEEQIDYILTSINYGREISDNISFKLGEQIKNNFPNLDLAITGNHDRVKFAEGLEDSFKTGLVNIDGINLYSCPGGGDIPSTAFLDESLMADDREFDRFPHQIWQQGLVLTPSIDYLVMHVPFAFDDESRRDVAGEAVRQALVKRLSIGKNMPKVTLYGHLHNKSTWKFREIIDDDGNVVGKSLVGTPGVSSVDHNLGPFSSACIAEINKESGFPERVREYRIWSSYTGMKDVELHGVHEIDWNSKKVNFLPKNERVIFEKDEGKFENFHNLDSNYFSTKNGFNTNYEGLTIKEKNKLFRQNRALADHLIEESSNKLRRAINWVRRQYFNEGNFDVSEMSRSVRSLFIEEVACDEGINFDDIENPLERKLIEDAYIQARFGLNPGIISYALHMDNPSKKELEKKWGLEGELVNHIRQSSENFYNELLAEGLDDDDYKKIIEEIYLPLNYTFARDLKIEEYQGLYNSAIQQGLLSTKQIKQFGNWFKEKENYVANSYSDQKIEQIFGSPYTSPDLQEERDTDSNNINNTTSNFDDMQPPDQIQELIDKLGKISNIGDTEKNPFISKNETRDNSQYPIGLGLPDNYGNGSLDS